ncbi:MAG: PEGA domain-containing protein [Methanoregulaceae archaeon]
MICCLALLALSPGVLAETYAIGDSVSLSGTAYGTDQMYLFVTGPDLNTNGVNPFNMKNPVVTGNPSTFAVVDVTDGSWSYTWVTAQIGLKLKEGIYTVYAVKQPVGKSGLSANDPSFYSSTDVTLTTGGRPYYSNGWILVRSEPSGATIYLNEQVSGSTPRNLTAPIGTSSLRLEMTGYVPVTKEITVDRGEVVTLDENLMPLQTTAELTESPTVTTTATNIPDTTLPDTRVIPLSPVCALVALACTACVFLQKQD